MLIETLLSSRLTRLLVLLISILTQVILLAFLTHFTPAPRIETTFGGASAEIIADRSWTILPGQCASITWKLEGIQSLYIDGQGAIGWGELKYCPGLFTTGPQFEVTASDGTARIIPVDIHYLLSVLAFAAGFSGMISVLTMAMYYAVKFHYDIRFPVWGMTIVVLALILIGELIALSSYKILIREFLSTLQSLFASRGWHLFGALLAGLIYLPLVFHASRQAIRSKAMQDLVAIGSFLLFVLLLYLPFGFESIAQFEDWVYHSWLDGHAFDFMTRELTLRFWEIVPHTPCTFHQFGFLRPTSSSQLPHSLVQDGHAIWHPSPSQRESTICLSGHDAVYGVSGQFRTDVVAFSTVAIQFDSTVSCCLSHADISGRAESSATAGNLAVFDIQYRGQ